jgi:hypothetical protein
MKTTVKKDFGVVSTSVVEITNEELWTIKSEIVTALRANACQPVRVLCATICKALNMDTKQIINSVRKTEPEFDPFADLLAVSADRTALRAVPTLPSED